MTRFKRFLTSVFLALFFTGALSAQETYKMVFENGMMKVISSPDKDGFYQVYTVPANQVRLETFRAQNAGSQNGGPIFQPVEPPRNEPPQLTQAQRFEQEVLRLTNQNRSQYGLRPLSSNGALHQAAASHSAEMLQRNYFSHTSPVAGRRMPSDRVRQAGINPRFVAENIFKCSGYSLESAAAVTVQSWMDSPGHRRNILDSRATHVGIGLATQGDDIVVTQVFGAGF